MIKFINVWTQGIILAVIIATIIELILPDGKNKKYVKTIIGIYILFSIVNPLITKVLNKNMDFGSISNTMSKEISKYDSNNLVTIETNAYIENTYKNKLEEDINQKVKDKGYNILQLDLYIEKDNEEKYGQINSIYIQLERNNKDQNKINNINKIKQIDINISNNEKTLEKDTNKENISNEEIKDVKNYLANSYLISTDNIHINE